MANAINLEISTLKHGDLGIKTPSLFQQKLILLQNIWAFLSVLPILIWFLVTFFFFLIGRLQSTIE